MKILKRKSVPIILLAILSLSILIYFLMIYFSDGEIKTRLNRDSITITQRDQTISTFKLKDISHV